MGWGLWKTMIKNKRTFPMIKANYKGQGHVSLLSHQRLLFDCIHFKDDCENLEKGVRKRLFCTCETYKILVSFQMGVSVKDVDAFEFNRAFAAFLKK